MAGIESVSIVSRSIKISFGDYLDDYLGDYLCDYLFSFEKNVSEREALVRRILVTKEPCKEGAYQVRPFINVE